MKIMAWISAWRDRQERRDRLDAERQYHRHDVNQSIQAIQSGAHLMRSMAGMNKLVREAERARNQE